MLWIYRLGSVTLFAYNLQTTDCSYKEILKKLSSNKIFGSFENYSNLILSAAENL